MVLTENIKEFVKDIAKYRKNIRIYPSNNPIYISTIDNVHSKISSLLEAKSELSLNFKQHEIIFNGDPVYENKEQLESLALFFFREGIRKVTFKKGLPRDELEEFMKIISCDPEAEADESDIVTLMWEKDFRFIQYVVDNSFMLEDVDYEKSAIKSVKENSATNEDILTAYQDAPNAAKISGIEPDSFTDDDLNQIIQKRENDPDEKSPKLICLLLEILLLVDNRQELEETTSILRSLISYSVEKENLENVICSIKKIKRSLNDSDYNIDTQTCLGNIEDFINSQEFIDQLGLAFDNRTETKDNILLDLAGLFTSKAIPSFINTLGELNSISSRRAFIKILTKLGRKDISPFIQYLTDSRWYLVRNVIHILRQIRDVSAIEHIASTVGHDHRKVRVEAIAALGEMGSETVLDILSSQISDPDDLIRVASIRAIGNIRTPDSKSIIINEITAKSFNNKKLGEKIELLKALNKWKDKDIADLLIRMLRKRSFLNKERNDETKAAAAYSLGLSGIKEVPPALLKLQNSKNLVLRKNVLNSIKLINNDKISG